MKTLDELLAEIEARAARGVALDETSGETGACHEPCRADVPRLVAALRYLAGVVTDEYGSPGVTPQGDAIRARVAKILAGEKP